jgi:hypothetical protein
MKGDRDVAARPSISFTGPSMLTPDQERLSRVYLRGVREAFPGMLWRSGGAFGFDTLVVEEAEECRLVVPKYRLWNRALRHHPAVVEVVEVDGGYRERNTALVDGSAFLVAGLKSPRFYRSGEWMTVNIAKRLGLNRQMLMLPSGS